MANLNRIILVGKLTADPDTKFTVEGLPMAKFSLEVTRFQREGSPPATDVIDIIAWRRLAEICGQYLKKGRTVLVEGRIQVRSYDDQSGQRKWATEVVARNMQMLDGKTRESAPAEPAGQFASDDSSGEEEDLPF